MVLAWSIVLLVALAFVLWRPPVPTAPTAPTAYLPDGHARLTESDQRLLHCLLTVLHLDAVMNDQVTPDQARGLYAKVVQSYNPMAPAGT